MTSCPPPAHEHEHQHQQRKPPALELLDEYWFFNNTLSKSNNKPPKPGRGQYKQQGSSSAGPPPSGDRRRLLRTPSLPSPGRVSRQGDDLQVEVVEHGAGNQQQQDQEVEDDDLNWSSIYEGVLRTRMAEGGGAAGSSSSSSSRPRPAALRRAPSMPVPGGPASSTQQMSSKPTPPPARGSNKPRQKQPVLMLARSRSTMFHDDKKWRSSSDLESIEVQGFRDLGFVFDKEDLRDSLTGVLPGLKPAANSRSTRPYLSEAWQQRPPALLRVQSEARSAAEVKDQLRMWAQAVACNARQEC